MIIFPITPLAAILGFQLLPIITFLAFGNIVVLYSIYAEIENSSYYNEECSSDIV
jgi:hypothetical protein